MHRRSAAVLASLSLFSWASGPAPLPAEIQSYTVYTGGLAAAGSRPDAAKAFLAVLSSDVARRSLAEKGMEPAPG